jgi:hypothetical protein
MLRQWNFDPPVLSTTGFQLRLGPASSASRHRTQIETRPEMTLRRIIVALAMLAILTNAMALARYNATMVAHGIDARSLDAALRVICTVGGKMTADIGQPGPSNQPLPDCPICLGQAVGAAIVLPSFVLNGPLIDAAPAEVTIADQIRRATASRWPPPRGPPSLT